MHKKFEAKIKNFAIGVCRGQHADKNRVSTYKTLR